jgi:hypothetical protein
LPQPVLPAELEGRIGPTRGQVVPELVRPCVVLVPMNPADLQRLQGGIVLVESASDYHTPRTGLRGSIEVVDHGGLHVQIALEFPQMFLTPAHHRVIPLSEADVARLLESEQHGTYELVIDGPLDPLASAAAS